MARPAGDVPSAARWIEELILRVPHVRACKTGPWGQSPDWRPLDEHERWLLDTLQHRFWIQNLSPVALDWLIGQRASRGRR